MSRDRQMGKDLGQIKADHVARYRFAAARLNGKRVLDLACGVGYGSKILHDAGNDVTGIDIEQDAINRAEKYYPGPTYICQSAEDVKGSWDVLVSMESIEHLKNHDDIFTGKEFDTVIASVPHVKHFPFSGVGRGEKYPHRRHYRPEDIEGLLRKHGFKVESWHCQVSNSDFEVTPGIDGRFIIFVAKKEPSGTSLSERKSGSR